MGASSRCSSLLEILFSVVAPGVMPYIAKAKARVPDDPQEPGRRSSATWCAPASSGFQQFADNILDAPEERR